LFFQVLARLLVSEVEAVLINQPFLVLQPAFPCGLGNFFIDTFANRARVRREVEAYGFLLWGI
jgi:hypothetical protein